MENSLTKTRIEIFLVFALYLFILPRVYMDYDMGFWREWALAIHRTGITKTYTTGINYFPVYIYLLYLYDLLQGSEACLIHNINNIKIFFVFFDFLPLFTLCCFRQKMLAFKIPYLFLLLNIAYVFNSMVWGQIDSIYANLAFLAVVTGIFYPVASVLLYLAALNTKPQAIEFLPVIGIVLFYSMRRYQIVLASVGAAIILQVLLVLPFISNGGIYKLASIAFHSVGLYPKLSICAFNIWYLIARGNPYFINDSSVYLVFSYKVIGFIMFALSGLVLMVPLAKRIAWYRKNNLAFGNSAWQLLFLATGLLCLFFFYFNSEMHERYAQPIIIFFFFYGAAAKNYKLYVLASIPYFLSLDKCFPDYLPVIHYKIVYASVVIALWYSATVAYGSYLYYKLVRDTKYSGPYSKDVLV
jgi:Gpi18-like mannosyltransferase